MAKETTFHKEFKKHIHVFTSTVHDSPLCRADTVLEIFKDYVSGSEYNALDNKNTELADLLEKERKKVRESKEEISAYILSVKPRIPQFVADALESIPEHHTAHSAMQLIKSKVEDYPSDNQDWMKIYNWLFIEDEKNKDYFVLAWNIGYVVVDYVRYKNSITGYYLAQKRNGSLYETERKRDASLFDIESMKDYNLSSYEKVE